MIGAGVAHGPDGLLVARAALDELPTMVAGVCRYVCPDDPQSVSQRAFTAKRAAAGFPDCPPANGVTQRMKMGWDAAKRVSLGEVRVMEHAVGWAQGVSPRDAHAIGIDREHAKACIRAAAFHLRVSTLRSYEYTDAREQMIALDKRRHQHGGKLEMPTAHQIEYEFGSWTKAVTEAGLAAPELRTVWGGPEYWTDDRIIEWLIRWLAERPPRTRKRDYDAWHPNHPGSPAFSTIVRHGGARKVLPAARERLARRRRAGQSETLAPEQIDALPGPTRTRGARLRHSTDAQKRLIEWAKLAGVFTTVEAAAALDKPTRWTSGTLALLHARGLVDRERYSPPKGGNAYRYRWVGDDSAFGAASSA